MSYRKLVHDPTLSLGGVPVAPVPKANDPFSHSPYWLTYSGEVRQKALYRFDGEQPLPNENTEGPTRFWSEPGCTIRVEYEATLANNAAAEAAAHAYGAPERCRGGAAASRYLGEV